MLSDYAAMKNFGWGARIRTWEWRNQNPLPYHLATPQQVPESRSDFRVRRADHSGATLPDQRPLSPILYAWRALTPLERGLDYAMTYRAPVDDIAFSLKHGAGLNSAL